MALDPHPFDVVLTRRLVQAAPQVLVLYRLAVRSAPALALPGMYPAAYAQLDVLRVRVDPRPAGLR